MYTPMSGVLAVCRGVVEGVEEGIDEEDPMETFGIEIGRHHGAIGQDGFGVEFVEDASKYLVSPAFSDSFDLSISHLTCSGEKSE